MLQGQLLCHLLYAREENVTIALFLFVLHKSSLRGKLNFLSLKRTLHRFSSNSLNRSDFLLCTCAVFLDRHDINKTVKDMHLCSCYQTRNLNLHSVINNKFFSDKFFILKFLLSDLELEQFYLSSSSNSEKLFFRVQVRVWQNNGAFSSLSSSLSLQPCFHFTVI